MAMLSSRPLLKRAKTVNTDRRIKTKGKQSQNDQTRITINTSHANSSFKALSNCFKYLGNGWHEERWDILYVKSCDIYWHEKSLTSRERFIQGKVNKFPGMKEIVCKAKFAYLLNRLRSLFPKHFSFYPRTWIALQEMMTEVMKLSPKELNSTTFIVKPDGGSEGRGIFLLQGLKQLEALYFQITEAVVIQKYISNPYLIDGFKFDLRLYAVLTNLNPLETYIFRDGLARFCTVPYQIPNLKNLRQTCMHLTNYSLNKSNPSFVLMNNPHEGSKRTISSVLKNMENLGHSIDIIWFAIEQLVAKTIIAMLPSLKIEFDSWNAIHKVPDNKFSCFHILGFDVILDEDLKPHLLEVNANPSLNIEHERYNKRGISSNVISPVDEYIKCQLIAETLKLVQPSFKASKVKISHNTENIEKTTIQFSNIFPKLSEEYSELRIIERACRIPSKEICIADLDVLFINMTRNYRYGYSCKAINTVHNNGKLLDFDGFYEILLVIARKKFYSDESIIEHIMNMIVK
ncbi:uncharacterized protein TRIADDRAFT_53460 [Trichoplax adhaerens]|uniref:Tubulin--tyrosine ligase-like protein 9 n=1 Tax=Trichoplax adhaerens TaxID=10228 RepID=B3RPA2_TRIAD|nr:hypothetical protein TRIADDRAFT_53460 [Trichoplax adhaerens]EDV28153.1 hypothetical protein TRIADDRAFT_53460 [Trichoplax adhaerens]|eukprot:XP_002109987.1 hypothetical protein TRIADDRAFT_53460 [Trichoplax adhaerens]